MTYAEFIARFPEFSTVTQSLVESKIADAIAMTSEAVFGKLYDSYVGYYAAAMLATCPEGRDMKLTAKDGFTIYDTRLEQIKRAVPARGLVT